MRGTALLHSIIRKASFNVYLSSSTTHILYCHVNLGFRISLATRLQKFLELHLSYQNNYPTRHFSSKASLTCRSNSHKICLLSTISNPNPLPLLSSTLPRAIFLSPSGPHKFPSPAAIFSSTALMATTTIRFSIVSFLASYYRAEILLGQALEENRFMMAATSQNQGRRVEYGRWKREMERMQD